MRRNKLIRTLLCAAIAALFTACSHLSKPATNVSTWTVAPKRADCVGVAPMKCLVIQDNTKPNSQPTFLYSNIEGFDYLEGFEYRIEVESTTVANPPADGSSIRYRLVKLLSKTAKN